MVSFTYAIFAALLSVTLVNTQAPPTPKYDTVVESKIYPGVKISYKAVCFPRK
jgi:hypothetical protein